MKKTNEIVEQIQSGEINSVDCESDIFCPWCGSIHEISDDYELYEDGDHEVFCGDCEKEFVVTYSNEGSEFYEGANFKPREVMVLITNEKTASDAEIAANEIMFAMEFNIDDHWKCTKVTELFTEEAKELDGQLSLF